MVVVVAAAAVVVLAASIAVAVVAAAVVGQWASTHQPLLRGSWVVRSGVIRRITIIITHIRGLITPLISTHEPPSILPPIDPT